eukprot:7395311-Pyramimonas_sp.AAC.1
MSGSVPHPVGPVRWQILRLARWFRSLLNPSSSSVHRRLQFPSRLPRDEAGLARREEKSSRAASGVVDRVDDEDVAA